MTLHPLKAQLCESPQQQQAWLDLRWQVLREPWQSSERRPNDEAGLPADHRALIQDEQLNALACGQLTWPERGTAQIRNMAVSPSQQNQGLGLSMVRTLETWAGLRGADSIIAMARDSSLSFYQKAGYTIGASGPCLFDQIPHHWVSKSLPGTDFSSFGLQCASATNDDSKSLMTFIFSVLADYGLQPETDGIDQDLINPETAYAGGFLKLLRDQQHKIVASIALLPREQGTVELRRMYVHPDWRGRGLGQACLSYAMQKGRELGFTRMSLETASVLKEALALYRLAGFQAVEGTRHARRCDLYMELDEF